jgi:hypothetical protein
MPMALMEVAPLPGIFLCLFGVFLFLQLGLVVLILSIFYLSFLCRLLPRELMSMPCYLSLIIFHAIVQENFLPSLSQPLYSLSLALIPSHPQNPIKFCSKSMKPST